VPEELIHLLLRKKERKNIGLKKRRDSSVGVATRLWAGRSGF